MSASPYDLVRVSTDQGEFTTSRAHAKRAGLKVIDRPATDHSGKPLPGKPRTSKAGQSPAPRDKSKTETKEH